VPYPAGYEARAQKDLEKQAATIVQNLKAGMVKAESNREIIALIAYLQRLGTDIKAGQAPKTADLAPLPQTTVSLNP
jgi:cytochrome c oxidase cbb3-type subunit I/II